MRLPFAQSFDGIAEHFTFPFPLRPYLGYLVAAAVLLIVLLLLRRLLRRRKARREGFDADLVLDVAALAQNAPGGETLAKIIAGPPTLEFFNLPVRLFAVIVAPVGRLREAPSDEELSEMLDCIVPGLDQIAAAHRPAIRVWPRQVSVRGFAHAVFTNVKLPDERDKKNPWSIAAGLFKVDDQPMMAGLVLQAERPNRHGQYIMQREEDWLGILRIRLY